MGEQKEQRAVLLVVAVLSRYGEVLEWADRELVARWGAVAVRSPRFAFTWSNYYEPTMGRDLEKYFLAFQQLLDPAELAGIKVATNELERQAAERFSVAEPRPLNLDPGYLTEAKLVLATTKDRDHRIYLQQGIFAEVTLHFHAGQWKTRPWTYPDYASPSYHQFFDDCRAYLRGRYRVPRDHRGA